MSCFFLFKVSSLTEEALHEFSVVLVVLVSKRAVETVELAVVGVDLGVKRSSEFSDLGKTSVQTVGDTESKNRKYFMDQFCKIAFGVI